MYIRFTLLETVHYVLDQYCTCIHFVNIAYYAYMYTFQVSEHIAILLTQFQSTDQPRCGNYKNTILLCTYPDTVHYTDHYS